MRISPALLSAVLLAGGCSQRHAEPHASAADTTPTQMTANDWRQQLDEGRSAAEAGDEARATAAFRAAVAATAQLGTDSAERAECLATLAAFLAVTSSTAESERAWRDALAACDAAFGADDLNAAACRDGLARTMIAHGGHAEAETLLQAALGARERRLGPDHDDVAFSRAMLADVLRAQDRLIEAEPLYRQALATWDREGHGVTVNRAAALHGLALVREGRGDARDARALLERAVTEIERANGREAPALVPVLGDLAGVRLRAGEDREAEALLQRSLAICEDAAESDAGPVAEILAPLAGIAAARGDHATALAALQRVVAIRRAPGTDPRALGVALLQVAEVCRLSGDTAATERACQEACGHWQAQPDADGVEVGLVLNGLAAAVAAAGRSVEAESLLARAERTIVGAADADDQRVIPVLDNQVALYAHAERWGEAVAVQERILGIRERQADRGAAYVQALNGLIGLCARAGDVERAIALNEQAVSLVERSLGPDDPNVLTARRNGQELLRLRAGDGSAEESATPR